MAPRRVLIWPLIDGVLWTCFCSFHFLHKLCFLSIHGIAAIKVTWKHLENVKNFNPNDWFHPRNENSRNLDEDVIIASSYWFHSSRDLVLHNYFIFGINLFQSYAWVSLHVWPYRIGDVSSGTCCRTPYWSTAVIKKSAVKTGVICVIKTIRNHYFWASFVWFSKDTVICLIL